MIDLTNFVDINIERSHRVSESGSAPEVLLFLNTATLPAKAKDCTFCAGANSDQSKFYYYKEDDDGRIIGPTTIDAGKTKLDSYLKIFFANGGVRIRFAKGKIPTGDTAANTIKGLSTDNVILAQIEDDSTAETTEPLKEAPFKDIADVLGTLSGVYQKIFVGRSSATFPALDSEEEKGADFVAIKYSKAVGAEMSIAAYLSKMKCYSSVKDYDFTQEFGINEDLSRDISYTGKADDKSVADIPYNFEMRVAGRYLNIGGNTVSGNSLVEQFATIVLTQTSTDAVFEALSTKLSGVTGAAALNNALSAELSRYTNSGFLVTDRIWAEPDLKIANPFNANDVETVITQTTPLSSGYSIHVFNLDDTRRKVYIFMILATARGIRFVKVDGRIMA